MALVDVSELLTDPDFIDKMLVINRVPSVNSFGENLLTETVIDSVGSVQPADGKTIQRLAAEGLQIDNVSSFWFKGKLIASEPGKYTAVITFAGKRYNVQKVMDWTNWGAGWCEGTCIQVSAT